MAPPRQRRAAAQPLAVSLGSLTFCSPLRNTTSNIPHQDVSSQNAHRLFKVCPFCLVPWAFKDRAWMWQSLPMLDCWLSRLVTWEPYKKCTPPDSHSEILTWEDLWWVSKKKMMFRSPASLVHEAHWAEATTLAPCSSTQNLGSGQGDSSCQVSLKAVVRREAANRSSWKSV